MPDMPGNLEPSTPEATGAVAQSREPSPDTPATAEAPAAADGGAGPLYTIGPGVGRAVGGRPYERHGSDPIYRPLRIFTLDPSVSRLEGSVALVNVPYEPLHPGPAGQVFLVEDTEQTAPDVFDDEAPEAGRGPVDLDHPSVLIRNGRDPSPSNRQFHQQMVYAVCSTVYAAFRKALGRHIAWGFDREQLRIRPHAARQRNAFYHKESGELRFGYFRAETKVDSPHLPGGLVFTCLSHDIVAHEVTHALLDGLRAHFAFPSGPDILAFHEAFADLIALFQHFSYDQVVRVAIRKSRGDLRSADLLTDLARQFGHTIGLKTALRSAIDVPDPSGSAQTAQPDAASDTDAAEPHERGRLLVTAVFDAFNVVFRRKTERYLRLGTNGSGVLPVGEISPDLQAILAEEASKLANQFLTICIRAIDYCPPVDLEFGEFLRAVITADRDLVPDDPWGYREAWIDAFRERGIFPRGLSNLSEDALVWRPPRQKIPPLDALSFAELKFRGDPALPAGPAELQRQADALGRVISSPEYVEAFGLVRPGDPRLGRDAVDLPCVQSIRSSRRVGPDGQLIFDLIAEITQQRTVRREDGTHAFDFYGGATLVLDPNGNIRYAISKNVLNEERLDRQRGFLSRDGNRFWMVTDGKSVPTPQPFKLLHGGAYSEEEERGRVGAPS